MQQQSPWNTLEIAKLVIAALTPIAVALLGLYLTRLGKRFDHIQWRNQRLIEKRISIYEDIAPFLNDLLCYFTFVGCWKDLKPFDVIAMKRTIDKKVYLASPIFSEDFYGTTMNFINLCYDTFQGWGLDAKLRTPFQRRKEALGSAWQAEWEDCFSEKVSKPEQIRAAYQEVMYIFSRDIGISTQDRQQPLGNFPANIK